MAELKPFEQIDAGGVDSRSNPINMPRNRALRCLNWCPKQAGFWELRWGYTTVTMSTVTASAIHSIFPYRTWDGNKYVLFMQGTTLNVLNTATSTVTTPAVMGSAMQSSTKGAGFFANNHFHYGNGTDQKFFDATTWRDSGLPIFSQVQFNSIVVTEGVRELTAAEAASVTVTAAGGGSFPADILTGHLIYVALFDTSVNEVGPATIYVASGRIKLTLNQKITVANMPVPSNSNWVKLIGGTIDGGNLGNFFINTSSIVTYLSQTGSTVTVTTLAGHGLSNGDIVSISAAVRVLAPAVSPSLVGVFVVTVVDGTHFTVQVSNITGLTGSTGGGSSNTVKRVITAANATTSIDVTSPTQDTSYQVNQLVGLAASTIGGVNAGYQFYACIYNPNGGGHVGNRYPIGGRALQTAYRSNWHLSGFPGSLSPEWNILIGRTGDGAQVPYPCADNALNWAVLLNGGTSFTVNQGQIDGAHEMPTRNGIIPSQCNMFCLAGDYAYAMDTGSPTLRRSGSFADYRAGIFVGDPAQSWAPNDIDTFPTAEAVTGMFEVDQEVFCGTLHDSAVSTNLAGIQQWAGGPWAVGIAGRRAGTKCGPYGFYWVSGDKQLCTLSQGVPVIASEEYELAELSQIGDAYLSTVEAVYYRNASQNKDELRIEAQKTDGTPYTIIHDFKLREIYSAPGSLYGQGYSSQFTGPLATSFTSALIRDSNGKLQVYAGASTGQLYQLYTGADDVGGQYTADLILLINGGPNRPSVPFFDFYGDQNIEVTVGRNLSSSIALGAQWGFDPPSADADIAESVPGSEQDFLYRVFLVPSEVQRLYTRFQLTSHSADGNLNMNSPPHVPLENYGRLYEIIPVLDGQRGR